MKNKGKKIMWAAAKGARQKRAAKTMWAAAPTQTPTPHAKRKFLATLTPSKHTLKNTPSQKRTHSHTTPA